MWVEGIDVPIYPGKIPMVCQAVLGRVFENLYSSGVEYLVKFWSGVEWSTENLEYYSSIWSILRSSSGSSGGSKKIR